MRPRRFRVETRRWTQIAGHPKRCQERAFMVVTAEAPKRAAVLAGMPATARNYYRSFYGGSVDFTNEVRTWVRDRRNWTTWHVRELPNDRISDPAKRRVD